VDALSGYRPGHIKVVIMASTFISELLSAHLPVIMELKKRDGHGEDLFWQRLLRKLCLNTTLLAHRVCPW
jgi:hypothetical protein